MAWPFSSVAAPTVESATNLMDVPTSSTAVPNIATSDKVWLLGIWIINTSTDSRRLTIVDGSDGAVLPASLVIPGNGWTSIELPFLPLTGVKWSADLSGLKGKVWGYK